MALGPWQIVIIVLLIVLFFGRGRISELMGDLAKGITSFKKGLREDEDDTPSQRRSSSEPPRISDQTPPHPDSRVETRSETRDDGAAR